VPPVGSGAVNSVAVVVPTIVEVNQPSKKETS